MLSTIGSRDVTSRNCSFMRHWKVQRRLMNVPVHREHFLNISILQNLANFFVTLLVPSDLLTYLFFISIFCEKGLEFTDPITVPTKVTPSTFHESFVPLPTCLTCSFPINLGVLNLHCVAKYEQLLQRTWNHLQYQHGPLLRLVLSELTLAQLSTASRRPTSPLRKSCRMGYRIAMHRPTLK
jgi:hypothetical protein